MSAPPPEIRYAGSGLAFEDRGAAELKGVPDSAGEVTRTWTTAAGSVQEHLSTLAYMVEGDELVGYFHDVAWGNEDRPSLSRSVELEGLPI